MAKLTFLELTNRVLKRISRNEIADVSTATGTDLMVTEFINEAQTFLFTEVDWYSLYRTRRFNTVLYTSAGVITFADADPDTIADASSGFVTAGITAGMDILINGSDDNNSTVQISSTTVAAGLITLATSELLANETATAGAISITAATYPVASDYGRTIDLFDITNNKVIIEDDIRFLDEQDPNQDYTGIPITFTLQGDHYRLSPMPAAIYKLRERYWAEPAALTANANTSDLPKETENLLHLYALYNVLNYLQKYEESDRIRIEFERQKKRAEASNKRKIDKLLMFKGSKMSRFAIAPARLPASYDRRINSL